MMETEQKRKFSFYGNGTDLLSIYLINFLLIIVTLGFYYPWAKLKVRKYLYSEMEFEGSRFVFNGTGKEMFLGYLKGLAIFLSIYLYIFLIILSENQIILITGFIAFYFALIVIVAMAVHGGYKYKLSRTSWRSVRFGYRGTFPVLLMKFVKGIILSIFTLGFYNPWFVVEIRKYMFENTRFGNIQFSYVGKGQKLFLIALKGFFLTFLTLGVYSFWYAKELFNFYINNIRLDQAGTQLSLKSTAKGIDILKLALVNFVIVTFTLGIGMPWAIIRQMRFIADNIELEGNFNPSAIKQTEDDFGDSTGDQLMDFLDIGII